MSARWLATWPTSGMLAGVLLLPLPAVADFVRHEAYGRVSGNARRWSSGVLLGAACGVGVTAWIRGVPAVSVTAVAWLVVLEFAVMLTLRATGRLEGYAARYEAAVLVAEDRDGLGPQES